VASLKSVLDVAIRWRLLICAGLALGGVIPGAEPAPPDDQPGAASLSEEPIVVELVPHEAADDQRTPSDSSGRMVDFQLTDQLGRVVTRESLLGQPWIANFIFISCETHCPATLREVYYLQRQLKGTDVRFVTITVDPLTDTCERMAEKAQAFGADPENWYFLSGDPLEVQRVVTEGFQQPMEASPMRTAHSLNLMHVDAEGRVVGKYRYDWLDPEGPSELAVLRKVLAGDMETPEKNRFLPTLAEAATTARAAQSEDEGASSPGDEPPASTGDSPTTTGDAPAVVPAWVDRLRSTNAMLNGLATLLLLAGFAAIKGGNSSLHKRLMLTAFATSVAFLACYLTYHTALHHFTGQGHKPYSGNPSLLIPYRVVLVSHIALAAVTPVLAIITIRRGLREDWAAHRRIAKVTFPIWLYVSITGVMIYFMNL
jgi:protein SCO1/2